MEKVQYNSLISSFTVGDQVSHPHNKAGQIIVQ